MAISDLDPPEGSIIFQTNNWHQSLFDGFTKQDERSASSQGDGHMEIIKGPERMYAQPTKKDILQLIIANMEAVPILKETYSLQK